MRCQRLRARVTCAAAHEDINLITLLLGADEGVCSCFDGTGGGWR